ncbi:MAG: hypothetical protein KC657_11945 [Myxococcales bacterium]|nr:hypothetical protein [Myxococcales bacterium]
MQHDAKPSPTILEQLFDALSHFEEEMPSLATLLALVDEDVSIVDGPFESSRGDWIAQLAAKAARRALRGEGRFFVVRDASVSRAHGETTVSFLVEEQRTVGGNVVDTRKRGGSIVVTHEARRHRIRRLTLTGDPPSSRRMPPTRPMALPGA